MFDLKDRFSIQKLIDSRDSSHILIPLYVRINKEIYPILEMDKANTFTPSSFKIGYGTSNSIFIPNSFDQSKLMHFNAIDAFWSYNIESDMAVRYTIFETGRWDDDIDEEDSILCKDINLYYNILSQYVSNVVQEKRKKLIQEEMESNS